MHSLGLKSGLYTAKGPHTCASFAASCQHEVQDAAQWASWGVDYVKDDSCSACRNDDNLDYHTMWLAMELTQRPMVLTVEGRPDDALISQGGYGNAKRVGHDISPTFGSMISLVDIGAGLWPFAHNSTNPTFGGWWNECVLNREPTHTHTLTPFFPHTHTIFSFRPTKQSRHD